MIPEAYALVEGRPARRLALSRLRRRLPTARRVLFLAAFAVQFTASLMFLPLAVWMMLLFFAFGFRDKGSLTWIAILEMTGLDMIRQDAN